MRSYLQKILILLAFSLVTLVAQDAKKSISCEELNVCFEKCADDDESCMDKCDANYVCPDDQVDTES
jgi:hypothetical protein